MGKGKTIPPLKVFEVMTKDVRTISEDDSIETAFHIFEEKDYNAIPVVREGLLVGVITKLDMLKAIYYAKTPSHPGSLEIDEEVVSSIMRQATVTIKPDDDIRNAAAYMIEFRLRALPVVKAGKVVGMISEGDIMDHLQYE